MKPPKFVVVRPIRWSRPRQDELEREIRRRLKIADPFVAPHAFDRLAEREEQGRLNSVDMMRILNEGAIHQEPEQEDAGWKVIVELRMPGARTAGVVTLVVHPWDDLEVWTVEWMDWR